MARKPRSTDLQLPNVRKYLGAIKGETAQVIARDTVYALKALGPYWSGTFEQSWVVSNEADEKIPAIIEPVSPVPPSPAERRITPVNIPDFRANKNNPRLGRTVFKVPAAYTIGNSTTYRDTAMDLVPGRVKSPGGGTAPEGWYITFLRGGGFDVIARRAIKKAPYNAAWKQSFAKSRTTNIDITPHGLF